MITNDFKMSKRMLLRFVFVSYLSILCVILIHHYILVDFSTQMLTDLASKTQTLNSLRSDLRESLSKELSGPPFDFSVHLRFVFTPKSVNCSNSDVAVILKSRPEEFYQRVAIRETWGKAFKGKLVFVLGRSSDNSDGSESAIMLESRMYGDILLVDFIDSYHNLSLKSLSALKWISSHCHDVQFYLQGDTDALIFPKHVQKFIHERQGQQQKIYGYCWKGARVRRSGKWRVDVSSYIPLTYPTYCSGAVMLMTSDVPPRLLQALDPYHPYFPIDDAFFTGILAEAAFIQRVMIPGIHWVEDLNLDINEDTKCNCLRPLAVMEYKSSALLRNAWKTFNRYLERCQ